MDKYEYKARADEIKSLVAKKQYASAAEVADSIDWTRVKSVMMLTIVSDIYKINRRLEDSKRVLLLAYERHPGSRAIVYSLCELAIKMEDYIQAVEYSKEFVKIAPKDTGRYILQYKLYEAQDVRLEERISVLEEFKKRDYREKWAYELAYLYHRIGLNTKCIEECDELIVWFGDGRFVLKAMELKMLHEPLSPAQQDKFDVLTGGNQEYRGAGQAGGKPEVYEYEEENQGYDEHDDIQIKAPDMSKYNTINLQKELAASMKEFMYDTPEPPAEQYDMPTPEVPHIERRKEEVFFEEGRTGQLPPLESESEPDDEEYDYAEEDGGEETEGFQEGTYINQQNNIPEVSQQSQENAEVEILEQSQQNAAMEALKQSQQNAAMEALKQSQENAAMEALKQSQENAAMEALKQSQQNAAMEAMKEQQPASEEVGIDPIKPQPETVKAHKQIAFTTNEEKPAEQARQSEAVIERETLTEEELGATREYVPLGNIPGFTMPPYQQMPAPPASLNPHIMIPARRKDQSQHDYEKMVAQEHDGQLRLVVPESQHLEKQITGQMDINDILAEWEETKKRNQEKRMADVKRKVTEQTGQLFSEFDEASKYDLLAMLDEISRKEEERQLAEERIANGQQEETQTEENEPDIQVEEKEPVLQAEEADLALQAEAASHPAMEEQETTHETECSKGEGDSQENALRAEITDLESKAEDAAGAETEVKEAEADKVRSLSEEQEELFGFLLHSRKSRKELLAALDVISLAPYTGNILVAGDEHGSSVETAMNLIKEVQLTDNNFSGKVAKVTAASLEGKNIAATFGKLENGALIVEKAGALSTETVNKMLKVLDRGDKGIIIAMEDTPKNIDILLERHEKLNTVFNARITVPEMNNDALVAHAKDYALDQEFSIDDLGILALYTRIADMQTSDHVVSMAEAEEIVDEAVFHACKKTPSHFMDILIGKRYDDEDMIILREKDFIND